MKDKSSGNAAVGIWQVRAADSKVNEVIAQGESYEKSGHTV